MFERSENPRKACVNCLHGGALSKSGWLCDSPHQGTNFDPVRGELPKKSKCEFQRSRLSRWLGFNTCGPEARYFAERPQPTPPREGSSGRPARIPRPSARGG